MLVNNAGWGYNSAIEEGEEEVVRAMFDANVFGLAAMMRRVLPGMRARGYGHIVNFSSIGGLTGNPGTGYYCATKFAVEACRSRCTPRRRTSASASRWSSRARSAPISRAAR